MITKLPFHRDFLPSSMRALFVPHRKHPSARPALTYLQSPHLRPFSLGEERANLGLSTLSWKQHLQKDLGNLNQNPVAPSTARSSVTHDLAAPRHLLSTRGHLEVLSLISLGQSLPLPQVKGPSILQHSEPTTALLMVEPR